MSWYTDIILSDDRPNPTLQVRWSCTNEQATACAPFIEHVAKMGNVELIYNGTTPKKGEQQAWTTWYVALPSNPSLGDVMKYVDQGIHAYQESTKPDDDTDWVGLL